MKPDRMFGNLNQKDTPPKALISVNGNPFLVSARAVYPTSGDGSSSGVILFGKLVNGNLLDFIRVDTGISLVEFYFPENAPATFQSIKPLLTADQKVYMSSPIADSTSGFVLLYGPSGEIAGLLDVKLPRTIFTEGRVAIRYLLGGMVLIAAVAMLVNLLISNFLLFKPLEQLAQRVRRANNLEEQIQTLADRPAELQAIGEPLETVLQRAQQTQQESLDRQTLYTRLFEQAREGFAILDPVDLHILEANQEFVNMLEWKRETEPEISFHELMGRWVDEEVTQKLKVSENEVAQGKVRLREQEVRLRGLDRDIEISISPIQAGQNRYLYALLRDVSERIQLEETLKEQLRETTLLNQVIAVTTSDLEPTAVFETVCRELSINLGVPQSALALFDVERTHLEVVAEFSKRRIPSSIGSIIQVEGVPSLTGALTRFDPLQVATNQAESFAHDLRDILEKRGTESTLLVPLIVRDSIIGWLALEDVVARQFDTEEVRLAQHMALAASRAYEVTALYHNLQDELNRRERAEEALDKRKRYLEALVNVLMDLLSLESGANVNEQVLPMLGMLTEADRVATYELSPSADGHSYLRQMDAWTSPNIDATASAGCPREYSFHRRIGSASGRAPDRSICRIILGRSSG